MILSSIHRLFLLVVLLCIFSSPIYCSPLSSLRLPSESPIVDTCPTPNSRPDSCPVKCFRTNPVCGEDGITYWCGCADAACNGVRVVKAGFCEIGNGGSGQALLLVHIVWLIVLGFFVVFGLF